MTLDLNDTHDTPFFNGRKKFSFPRKKITQKFVDRNFAVVLLHRQCNRGQVLDTVL